MKPGAVVWITGLPSAGKSTLAKQIQARLADLQCPAVVLDGDEVRRALVPEPGYSSIERDMFYATLGRLAALLTGQGFIVLVAATAHRSSYRTEARALAPRFVEVFVDVPLDECERRDSKGLFQRARAGQLETGLPGVTVPFERPATPDVRADGGHDERAIEQVVASVLRS
jgi:adenylylsulfate kinase-like enzyme